MLCSPVPEGTNRQEMPARLSKKESSLRSEKHLSHLWRNCRSCACPTYLCFYRSACTIIRAAQVSIVDFEVARALSRFGCSARRNIFWFIRARFRSLQLSAELILDVLAAATAGRRSCATKQRHRRTTADSRGICSPLDADLKIKFVREP